MWRLAVAPDLFPLLNCFLLFFHFNFPFIALPMTFWIDTHCHLDAAEFGADLAAVHVRAGAGGVAHCVIPAVAVANFEAVRAALPTAFRTAMRSVSIRCVFPRRRMPTCRCWMQS